MIDDDVNFDPGLWFLAMDGDEIAGLCLCSGRTTEDPEMGWVRILAVRRPWRRRGLGLALLGIAFETCRRKGCRRVGLSVDANSLTGATALYEKAGMHVLSINHTYQKELRAGDELSAQAIAQS
jgi:mycothiol synthase